MGFQSVQLPGLFAYRWEVQPTLEDLPQLQARLDAASASKPIALMVVVGDTQAPESDMRQKLVELTPKMMGQFASGCLVIEGSGLVNDTKRLLGRAMMLMAGTKTPIFDSAAQALEGAWCPPFLDGKATLAALQQRGLVR